MNKRAPLVLVLLCLSLTTFAQDKIGNFTIGRGKLEVGYDNMNKIGLDSLTGRFGTSGLATYFGGDYHLRGYWGVVIDKNGGNSGENTGYTGVNPAAGSFAIRTRIGASNFRTDFIIRNSGNVGIGTTAPSTNLQIGNGIGNLHYGNFGVLVKPDYGDRALMEFHSPNGENRLVIQSLSNASYLGNLKTTDNITSKPLVIQSEGGNVAIGSMNAETKLHITTHDKPGATYNFDGMKLDHYSAAGAARFATFYAPSLSNGAWNPMSRSYDAGIIFGGQGGGVSNDFGFVIGPWSNTEAGIRIAADGRVGIGTALTSNPNNYHLAVNGIIGAKGVKVETTSNTWPDFVFESTYKLPTLSQVETFIKENRHLPDVPSAKEVEKEGIDLGKMDATLLKKIEELTLYMIEMKKENDLQNKKIKRVLEENALLNQEIKILKANKQ